MKRKMSRRFFLFALLLIFLLTTPMACTGVSVTAFPSITSSSYTSGFGNFDEEDLSAPWTLMNASAGWSTRGLSSSVVMPDGSIVLMGGGWEWSGIKNDVWRSTDNGATWTRIVEHAPWQARSHHASVVMPDGSIVLMGGRDSNRVYLNDVWRSPDGGATWKRMTGHAEWSGRISHTCEVLSDGSIMLMGGSGATDRNNEVWRSTDYGATWTLVSASPGWTARYGHDSVVMPDGSIILMGGIGDSGTILHDVWRSTDNGATWTLVNPGAEWPKRYSPGTIVTPEGSIVLMGGCDGHNFMNDIWQSWDNGATWTRITAAAEWPKRYGHNSVLMPDGSIVLMGGVYADNPLSYKNDVWRLVPSGLMLKKQSEGILVTKRISPVTLKQGTDARITISIFNRGPAPVHDVDILDTTLPEFPVINGITQYSVPLIEPNDTRILTYTVHATKTGSFRLKKTAVMYADQDGNYHLTYSDYEKVEVLAPLISPTPQNKSDDLLQNLIAWFNGLGLDE